MPASSLTRMAQNAAIKNIDNLTDVSTIPYHAIEPILRRLESPQQLRDLEVLSPHIGLHTGPLWISFIQRDVANANSKIKIPDDPKTWWMVYKKMLKQEAADKKAAEANLQEAMKGAKGEKMEVRFLNKQVKHTERTHSSGFLDGVPKGIRKVRTGIQNTSLGPSGPSLRNARSGSEALAAMARQSASRPKIFNQAPMRRSPFATPVLPAIPAQTTEARRLKEQKERETRETERRLREISNTKHEKPVSPPASSSTTSGSSNERPRPCRMRPRRTNRTEANTVGAAKEPAKPAPLKRKRPAANPFLTAPKRAKK